MKLRDKPQLIGLLLGIIVTVPACLVAFASSGAGHGTYFAFKLVFPITMLSALIGGITIPFILVGLAQFPAYGYFVGRDWNTGLRSSVVWKVVGFHVAMAILAVAIPNSSFS